VVTVSRKKEEQSGPGKSRREQRRWEQSKSEERGQKRGEEQRRAEDSWLEGSRGK